MMAKKTRCKTRKEKLQSIITANMKEWLKAQVVINEMVESWDPEPEEYNLYVHEVVRSINLTRNVMKAYNELLQLND